MEHFVDLLFGSVERKVAKVERGCLSKSLLLLMFALPRPGVAIYAQSQSRL